MPRESIIEKRIKNQDKRKMNNVTMIIINIANISAKETNNKNEPDVL